MVSWWKLPLDTHFAFEIFASCRGEYWHMQDKVILEVNQVSWYQF